jgi:hypothetical protein
MRHRRVVGQLLAALSEAQPLDRVTAAALARPDVRAADALCCLLHNESGVVANAAACALANLLRAPGALSHASGLGLGCDDDGASGRPHTLRTQALLGLVSPRGADAAAAADELYGKVCARVMRCHDDRIASLNHKVCSSDEVSHQDHLTPIASHKQ